MAHHLRGERRSDRQLGAWLPFLAAIACAVVASSRPATAQGASRLEVIRARGHLVCGVSPGWEGWALRDASGGYAGFDVDICRAVAAAILGPPGKVRYAAASDVRAFTRGGPIDMVSRRISWELGRERPYGLLFGPTTFYDGQGFLVARTSVVRSVDGLTGRPVCFVREERFEETLRRRFEARGLELRAVALAAFSDAPAALESGRCEALTADVSELGSIRTRLGRTADYEILDEQISKEPLAQVVRATDRDLHDVLRWTVFALIEAEELGVTAANAPAMRESADPRVRRLLGVEPGPGRALGLWEGWAYDVVRSLGNYGEVFDRNVGAGSPLGLRRGPNRPWTQGGLLYAPPFR